MKREISRRVDELEKKVGIKTYKLFDAQDYKDEAELNGAIAEWRIDEPFGTAIILREIDRKRKRL